jgi:hypothetical protein
MACCLFGVSICARELASAAATWTTKSFIEVLRKTEIFVFFFFVFFFLGGCVLGVSIRSNKPVAGGCYSDHQPKLFLLFLGWRVSVRGDNPKNQEPPKGLIYGDNQTVRIGSNSCHRSDSTRLVTHTQIV